VPKSLLTDLINLLLKNKIFEFNGDLYKQKIGTAMGTRVAPTMANIFMAKIDKLLQKCVIEEHLN
jgi:hypothetical protein